MKRFLRFRTHAAPSLALPLNVRSTGYYQLEAGSQEEREPGNFVQIFWCSEGTGTVRVGKKKSPLRPGTVFYYLPGEWHHLEAGRQTFGYYWLTLDGGNANSVHELFRLKREQLSGPCPVSLFEALDPCLLDATISGERKASVLAYEILLLAGSGLVSGSFPQHQENSALLVKSWVEKHHMDAHLNIAALSARFGIHRSTLYRIFMKTHGVSPVQYLNRIRIRSALEFLRDESLSVADVAVRSGIPDISYFSKQIRKHTGFGPRAYREMRWKQ